MEEEVVERWVRVCHSFEEEAEADREFWLRFSPEERVAHIEALRAEWARNTGAEQPLSFAPFLTAMADHRVRFLLVGAHAIAFHSKPHYTAQLDVFADPADETLRRVLAAADECGIRIPGDEPNRINVMTHMAGISFEEAWERRIELAYGVQQISVISREDLIRHKDAAGHLRDIADAELLRRFL